MPIPQSTVLAEADPASVQDLFNRNPAQNTQDDIDRLILYYRNLRDQLASSATVRHTRVKREEDYNSVDFSDL